MSLEFFNFSSMGNGPSLPDEITREQQTRALIVISPEAMQLMENKPVEDDYPVDTFAGRGFFEKPKEEFNAEEVQAKAEAILKKYPLPKNEGRVCLDLEEEVKRCYQIKADQLQCADQVDSFLQCSKASLFTRLASIEK